MEQHVAVTPERILQFGWGYAPTLAMEAAVKHGVFDVLDGGPKTLSDISAATGASTRGLRAILNLLVGMGLIGKLDDGCYALTPESAMFLVSSKPSYLGGIIRHGSEHLIPAWLKLSEVVATGKPAHSVNQEDSGSEFFAQFVADLFPMSFPSAQRLAQHLAFGTDGPEVRALDLAAGSGVWGIALAQSSPRVRVTAVDWPGVLPVTKGMVEKFGLNARWTFAEGDLASAEFGRDYDVATLGHILHSEGAERSRALLRKTREALAPGGTIAIAEYLVNADRTGPIGGLIFGVNMLVNTENGDAFSFEEISEWLLEAGFEQPRTLEAPGPSPLILATKR